MKVVIVSESPADEAVVHTLVEAVWQRSVEIESPGVRARSGGWTGLMRLAPAIVRHAYYHTDVEGLIVVLDADGTEPHRPNHETPVNRTDCRYCELQHQLVKTCQQLKTRPNRKLLHTAVGLAVPSLEAWLLCGADPHSSEAEWERTRNSLSPVQVAHFIRSLKTRLYDTDRMTPSLLPKVRAAAERAASDLEKLRTHFPGGFGTFVDELRAWPLPARD